MEMFCFNTDKSLHGQLVPSELQPSEWFQPRWLLYTLIQHFIHLSIVKFFQYWYCIFKRVLALMCSYFCFVFLCCLISPILDVLRTISWPTPTSSTSVSHSCSLTGHIDCLYCYTKERFNGSCDPLRKWESQTLNDVFSSQLKKLHGSRGVGLLSPFPQPSLQRMKIKLPPSEVLENALNVCITEDNGIAIY